jgi:hypothetical protein
MKDVLWRYFNRKFLENLGYWTSFQVYLLRWRFFD